jgi:hypothetical protein
MGTSKLPLDPSTLFSAIQSDKYIPHKKIQKKRKKEPAERTPRSIQESSEINALYKT